jgi:hypothetical protein
VSGRAIANMLDLESGVMSENELRQYLSEILPALADMADAVEAPDLGEAAFTLRLMAHKVGKPADPMAAPLRLVS